MKSKYKLSFLCSVAMLLLCGLMLSGNTFAQDEEKNIKSEALMNKRPALKQSVPDSSRKKVLYRIVRKSVRKKKRAISKTKPVKMEDALLGLTVWKLRPAKKDDPANESPESSNDDNEETLERIEADMPLKDGERIRLSVESLSHKGYLYVIDRELYSYGSYSLPKLIYPTLLTPNRNSLIRPGDLIFIPQGARHFRVKSKQAEKTQVAEVLTFIISPTPLIKLSDLQMQAIDIPLSQFEDWVDKWEPDDTTLMEEIDGAGKTITLVEQSAGQESAKDLTEESNRLSPDDPTPQTIFRSRIKSGNPYLVNVSIKYDAN
jgi:hypothetical protein